MAISGASLADGQLGTSKATIYGPVATGYRAHVAHVILTNTSGAAVVVNLYVKRSGSASRRLLSAYSLAANTSVTLPGEESAYRLSAGDVIEGDAASATTVDYFIDGGLEAV